MLHSEGQLQADPQTTQRARRSKLREVDKHKVANHGGRVLGTLLVAMLALIAYFGVAKVVHLPSMFNPHTGPLARGARLKNIAGRVPGCYRRDDRGLLLAVVACRLRWLPRIRLRQAHRLRLPWESAGPSVCTCCISWRTSGLARGRLPSSIPCWSAASPDAPAR